MVKKFKYSKSTQRRVSKPTLVGESIMQLLRAMGGSEERWRLANLWKNWPQAVGENFAWSVPAGHKGRTLLLEAQDAMEMQELSLQSVEILAKVNAYLQTEYFTELRVILHGFRGH